MDLNKRFMKILIENGVETLYKTEVNIENISEFYKLCYRLNSIGSIRVTFDFPDRYTFLYFKTIEQAKNKVEQLISEYFESNSL